MSGLAERLAREAARSVDAMDVDDLRTREDEIARVCAAAIRQALDEAVMAVGDALYGQPGCGDAISVIKALK